MKRAQAVWTPDWLDALLFVAALATVIGVARGLELALRTRELIGVAAPLCALVFVERRRWFRKEFQPGGASLRAGALVAAGIAAALAGVLCLLLPHKSFAVAVGGRSALGLLAVAVLAIAGGSLLERRA